MLCPYPDELIRQEGLYFIAGWLLSAAGKEGPRRAEGSKLKELLMRFASVGHEVSIEKRKALPIGKTDRSQRFGGLKFPSVAVYRFVAVVEKVCEGMLVNQSLVLYGDSMFIQLSNALLEEDAIKHLIFTCLNMDGANMDYDTANGIDMTIKYLLLTYMRMRAKDFVRLLMGRGKQATTVGHRREMAVVSNAKFRPSKKKCAVATMSPPVAALDISASDQTNVTVAIQTEAEELAEFADEMATMRCLMEEVSLEDLELHT